MLRLRLLGERNNKTWISFIITLEGKSADLTFRGLMSFRGKTGNFSFRMTWVAFAIEIWSNPTGQVGWKLRGRLEVD